MRITIALVFLLFTAAVSAQTRNQPVSQRLTETAMHRIWTDDNTPAGIPRKWTYDQGVILKGVEAVWYATGDAGQPGYFVYDINNFGPVFGASFAF